MQNILSIVTVGVVLSAIILGVNLRFYLLTLIDARRDFKDYRQDHWLDVARFKYLGYLFPYTLADNSKDDDETKFLIGYHNFWARYFWVSLGVSFLLMTASAYFQGVRA